MLVVTVTHSCCDTIRSLIKVTAPLTAYRPPVTLTPSRREIEVRARMLPLNVVELPRVADDPIWKKTLQARAPLTSTTDADEAVVSVEPIWNTNKESASFWPSRVSVPVRPTAEGDVYTPDTRVCPPRSAPAICEVDASELAVLYAVRAS